MMPPIITSSSSEWATTSMMSHFFGASSHRWMFSGRFSLLYTCHSVSLDRSPSFPEITSMDTPKAPSGTSRYPLSPSRYRMLVLMARWFSS